MSIFSAALLLFLVIDPIGNIPLFLIILKDYDPPAQRRIIGRELLFALLFLLIFLFSGRYLQPMLHISESSLSIAGGIILFLIALRLIFPSPEGVFYERIEGDPFIVPLAVPFIAGPTALAAISFIVTRDPDRWREWLLALLLAWALSGIILFSSSFLARYLGRRGLIAIERLMGMVLTTMAVQMFMSGVRQFIGTL
ncbi:MAG: MarC family protein [Deltaproteobacteria bacterium]